MYIHGAAIFWGTRCFPSGCPTKESSTETKTGNEQPVILGDKILFYLPTEAEGLKVAKRAEDISKRIKTIADSTRVKVDSITTIDFKSTHVFYRCRR